MSQEEIVRKTYNVKGRVFYQKELVLGQLELLVDLLKNIEFEKGLTNLQILKVLGGKVPRAMAIVLLEEGMKTDKIEIKEDGKSMEIDDIQGLIEAEDIKKLTQFFANNVDISLALKVIIDFFVCTPMTNIMQTLATLIPATQNPAPIV